jgi:outer membrane murein-binding lipoprotein Lpp
MVSAVWRTMWVTFAILASIVLPHTTCAAGDSPAAIEDLKTTVRKLQAENAKLKSEIADLKRLLEAERRTKASDKTNTGADTGKATRSKTANDDSEKLYVAVKRIMDLNDPDTNKELTSAAKEKLRAEQMPNIYGKTWTISFVLEDVRPGGKSIRACARGDGYQIHFDGWLTGADLSEAKKGETVVLTMTLLGDHKTPRGQSELDFDYGGMGKTVNMSFRSMSEDAGVKVVSPAKYVAGP